MRWSHLAWLPAAALALAGCTPTAPVSPSPTVTHSPTPTVSPTLSPSPSTTPSPSPSPSVVPSFPADLPTEDPESAAIIAGWQRYLEVYDKFAADPLTPTDWTETQLVTTGEEQTGILDSLQLRREARLLDQGGTVYRAVKISQPAKAGPDGLRTAVLTYCVDVSNSVLVNADTGKVFERPVDTTTYLETTTLIEAKDDDWRVATIRNKEATC